jgi:hypothetical protein
VVIPGQVFTCRSVRPSVYLRSSETTKWVGILTETYARIMCGLMAYIHIQNVQRFLEFVAENMWCATLLYSCHPLSKGVLRNPTRPFSLGRKNSTSGYKRLMAYLLELTKHHNSVFGLVQGKQAVEDMHAPLFLLAAGGVRPDHQRYQYKCQGSARQPGCLECRPRSNGQPWQGLS